MSKTTRSKAKNNRNSSIKRYFRTHPLAIPERVFYFGLLKRLWNRLLPKAIISSCVKGKSV